MTFAKSPPPNGMLYMNHVTLRKASHHLLSPTLKQTVYYKIELEILTVYHEDLNKSQYIALYIIMVKNFTISLFSREDNKVFHYVIDSTII